MLVGWWCVRAGGRCVLSFGVKRRGLSLLVLCVCCWRQQQTARPPNNAPARARGTPHGWREGREPAIAQPRAGSAPPARARCRRRRWRRRHRWVSCAADVRRQRAGDSILFCLCHAVIPPYFLGPAAGALAPGIRTRIAVAFLRLTQWRFGIVNDTKFITFANVRFLGHVYGLREVGAHTQKKARNLEEINSPSISSDNAVAGRVRRPIL